MRRSYRSERYLGIIDKVRAAMPDAAITTDIIVGFPGETEADFRHLDVVREARFSSAFTFQYSKRPGTPAATMDGPAAQAGGAGALRAADRLRSRRSPGRRTSAGRRDRRGAGRGRRGPQGRAPPAGCPAGPATADWCTSPPAERPRRSAPGDIVHTDESRTPPRTTSTPTARRWRTGAPGPVTRPRRAAPRVPPG